MNIEKRVKSLLRVSRQWFLLIPLLSLFLLAACGGGGGGDRAPGTTAGPTAPGGDVGEDNPTSSVIVVSGTSYSDAQSILPIITDVEIPDDGRPVVSFQVTDGHQAEIPDLSAADVRFVIAKLVESELGGFTGHWQSYINRIEAPGAVGSGTEPRLQATSERGTNGALTYISEGNYEYRFATDITDLDADILAQAASENLDLSYNANLTHRVSMQFSGGAIANPYYDWQPVSGATHSIFTYDVVATETCNNCHDPLAMHGGGRIETEYCVTCHNPGSSDANSGNTVDFKVMIHKIHRGASLPSVVSGGEYLIYGYRNSVHDYSELHFPQDIRNCQNCHAGTGTGTGRQTLTDQGDNWTQYPTQAACGSCHDDLDFTQHKGGQPDDAKCSSCHTASGKEYSIIDAHTDNVKAAANAFEARVLSVTDTAPGEFPEITFQIVDPSNGDQPWDILNDEPWIQPRGASRLAIDLSWDVADYHNSGNESDGASAVSINALTQATTTDNQTFTVTSTVAIPDGSAAPFIAATGSGSIAIEGHPALDLDGDPDSNPDRIPMRGEVSYFSIDEVSGVPDERRAVVDLDKCHQCHETISLHGSNRTDNIELCVTCHNPRNTDRAVRPLVANPPVGDGKSEESIDFKTMIHGIHAAGMRDNPLYVVGFRGFNVHQYDESSVHYPGDLSNCLTCHEDGSYQLPLAGGVLGTTVDSGDDLADPSDDTVISPITAVCASCHDDELAGSHMSENGGSFSTTQAELDSGTQLEQCAICHGPGRTADVKAVHGL